MEEKASMKELVVDFIRHNLLIVGLIFLGIVLSVFGGVQYLASKNNNSQLEFTSGDKAPPASQVKGTSDKASEMAIDVAGEVAKPGIYTLPPDSRVADAIDAAGGLTGNADGEYVSKKINLAQKVIDGGKIYIPAVGEIAPAPANPASNFTANISSAGDTTTGLIDVNSADAQALDTLPKIGPVTAKKIIDNRPYASLEELVSKKVLTQKTFDGLKDKITVQ